jgi:hypothetical protein
MKSAYPVSDLNPGQSKFKAAFNSVLLNEQYKLIGPIYNRQVFVGWLLIFNSLFLHTVWYNR